MMRKATYRTAKHAMSSVVPPNRDIFAFCRGGGIKRICAFFARLTCWEVNLTRVTAIFLALALSAFSAIGGIELNDGSLVDYGNHADTAAVLTEYSAAGTCASSMATTRKTCIVQFGELEKRMTAAERKPFRIKTF